MKQCIYSTKYKAHCRVNFQNCNISCYRSSVLYVQSILGQLQAFNLIFTKPLYYYLNVQAIEKQGILIETK